jgi:branched-chain amino acid transport system substrate-binding protein
MSKRVIAVAAALGVCGAALAQTGISDRVVRIGVLTDMAGPYADNSGAGSVFAAQMAAQDAGGKIGDAPIEVIYTDHQNKPDIGAAKAREWFDRTGVDHITDLTNSAVTLAIMKLAAEKSKVITTMAASNRITNEDCQPTTVHWSHDGYSFANIATKAVIAQGGDSWYFVTADYAFGHSLEKDASDRVAAGGGKVLGSVRHPFPGQDFSSVILRASQSGAKVVALANAGQDTQNALRTAREFGLTQKQRLVGLLFEINETHGTGLKEAQDMLLAAGFYWDMDDQTRAFSKRFFEKFKRMPTIVQAGTYSAVSHYLKAVRATGTDDGRTVAQKMRELPVNDMFARNGRIREDGRLVRDMYLAQVKKPEESKYAWDYWKIVRTIPGDEAFQPLATSRCPAVKK